jgi:hypothetical protein
MAAVSIAEFSRLSATRPVAAGLEWEDLAARLTQFSEREQKDGPGWSPVIYEDGTTRGNDNVLELTAAVIDIDHDEPEWGLLSAFEYVAHTTFSHTDKDRHWRVIIPFEYPVPRAEWKETWRRIQFWLAPAADEACKDESRFYWWPTCQPDAPREARHHRGAFLNPSTLKPVPEEKPRLTPVDRIVGEAGPDGERPGDRFTRETDWSEILRGWKLLSTRGPVRKWERPANGVPKQTPGCSATTGGGGYDVLYVFSSNAQPFEPNKSYSKFRAFSVLEHGGDDRAAASALSRRYSGEPPVWDWKAAKSAITAPAPAPADGEQPAAPAAPPAPTLRSLTADELLLGEPKPVPWLIHTPPDQDGTVSGGLLAEGDIGIIGAASGTGKTWLGAEISYSLASASPLFDAFTVARPCRVMIVDEESSAWLLRRRWLKILKGHEVEPEDFVTRHWKNLKVYVDNGFSFDNDRSLEALYIEAMTFQPDIVLFDTLARVHRRPENDNSEIAKLFEDRIKPFKREFGCAMFFLHHLRKPSKEAPNDPASMLRGASDLKGQLDQFWFLRGRTGEQRAIFEHDKCRAMPELPAFVIERIDTPNGGVRVVKVNEMGAVGATASEQHQDVILTHLIDAGRATRQQIIDFAKTRGIGKTNTDAAIAALITAGYIDSAALGREKEYFPVEMD